MIICIPLKRFLSGTCIKRVQIFYSVVAVFLILGVVQLYIFKSSNRTKYFKKNGLSKGTPNLEVLPMVNATLKTVFIRYDENNIDTVEKWIYLLDNFFEAYRPENLESYKIAPYCNFKHPPNDYQICPVNTEKFGPCNPPYYGFYNFSPCVFLRLRKTYNWIPRCYNDSRNLPSTMPNDLVEHIRLASSRQESNQIWISCGGVYETDKENIENFNYYPSRGIPSYFYPITFRRYKYLNPLIAVEIVNPKPGIIITIECRVWAKNIEYRGGSPEYRTGSVQFTVMRDELDPREYQDEIRLE